MVKQWRKGRAEASVLTFLDKYANVYISFTIKNMSIIELQKSTTQTISAEQPAEHLAGVEIAEKGYVKQVPRFIDQIKDTSRTNRVTYAHGYAIGVGNDSNLSDPQMRRTVTEHQALVQTYDYLEEAATNPNVILRHQHIAEDLIENVSFIGEKEYEEAAAGLADYWRTYLDSHDDACVIVIHGKMSEALHEEAAEPAPVIVKSDDYLLSKILENFTAAELKKYDGRLMLDADETDKYVSPHTKAVLLDDWIINGQQMSSLLNLVHRRYPHLDEFLEANLIISSKERIDTGFKPAETNNVLPVVSYYTTHVTNEKDKDVTSVDRAYITGFHSSVDYPFEDTMSNLLHALHDYEFVWEPSQLRYYLPPSVNIVRPYRSPEFNPDKQLLQRKLAKLALAGR